MIRISSLSKSYGSRVLFNQYSLEIEDREFVVFTGKSGCGKTTLLNMIGGIETVDDGEVVVNGFHVSKGKNLKQYYQSCVGFLFQNFALMENKTVEENLNIIQKKSRTDIDMDTALKYVGMEHSEKQKICYLSGGEQQRIALARLLMKKSDVILADEPTGSLDRQNALKVIELLHAFQDMGKTIIMVTHDLSLITNRMKRIDLPVKS